MLTGPESQASTTPHHLLTYAVAFVGAFWAASCGDKEPPTEPEPPNQAPVVMGTIPAQAVSVGETVTVDVSPYFSDPDGDALEYAATTSNAGVAAASVSGARSPSAQWPRAMRP